MFSWLRMKKPGPRILICFTFSKVFRSMTVISPSFRFGEAITRRSLPAGSVHFQVMPEPRCGMPGRSRSAIFLRPSR